jgi:flavodoxin
VFEVVYFSRTGNTRKVAEAIADELGVTARNIKAVDKLSPDSFVFLGTGCYGAVLPKDIAIFLKRNQFNGRKVALFTTSCFGSTAERSFIEKQISNQGAEITDNFYCLGHWMTMKKNHPNRQELENARSYARIVAARHSIPISKKVKTPVLNGKRK